MKTTTYGQRSGESPTAGKKSEVIQATIAGITYSNSFLDDKVDLLLLIVRCNVDRDYQAVLLARENEAAPYRAIDLLCSFPVIPQAEVAGETLLNGWKTKHRDEILEALK